MLSSLIDRIQAAWPINRVVVVLAPLYAGAAGAIATYAADKLPWLGSVVPDVPGALAAIFASVTLTAGAAAYKWLDGWQAHETAMRDTADLDAREPEAHEQGAV